MRQTDANGFSCAAAVLKVTFVCIRILLLRRHMLLCSSDFEIMHSKQDAMPHIVTEQVCGMYKPAIVLHIRQTVV